MSIINVFPLKNLSLIFCRNLYHLFYTLEGSDPFLLDRGNYAVGFLLFFFSLPVMNLQKLQKIFLHI